jgi:four helix bundle protein
MAKKPPFDLAERTFVFACAIVRFCRKLAQQPGVARQIPWQLADAGTSIAANYEEAKAAYSRRDFAAKNSIALKEARESRLWLRIIVAENLAPIDEVGPLLDEANQLVAILTTSVKRLRVAATAGASGCVLTLVYWTLSSVFNF